MIVVVEKTLDDMRDSKTTDPDWKDLLAWMRAIHAGNRVKCDAQEYALRSASQVVANIIIHGAFQKKHPSLVKETRLLADSPGCNWQVHSAPAEGIQAADTVDCKRKRDFMKFLLFVRRMVGQPRGPDGML